MHSTHNGDTKLPDLAYDKQTAIQYLSLAKSDDSMTKDSLGWIERTTNKQTKPPCDEGDLASVKMQAGINEKRIKPGVIRQR